MAMKDLTGMYGAFAYQELLAKYGIDMSKKSTKFEWENLCNNERENLTMDFIETFKDQVSWRIVTRYCKLTEDFIRSHADLVDWVEVSSYKNLSAKFIEDFKDKFEWSDLSQHCMMTKAQLLKYADRIDWDRAPTYQPKVDEEVVEAVLASNKKDQLNWHGLLVNCKFSEEFLEKHVKDIDDAGKWELVPYYQKLSGEFMDKYDSKMNWNYVSQKQKLSEDFIRSHAKKLNKTWILKFQDLSEAMKAEVGKWKTT
jgi:hypothetical protein